MIIHVVRTASINDLMPIFSLYKTVAQTIGGIAREVDEITIPYIEHSVRSALENGICMVVENPNNAKEIIAEVHCYKIGVRIFDHVLSNLTIVVHPSFQGKGVGKALFEELLRYVEKNRKDIFRIELMARENNKKAIMLYEKIGFKIEGRLEKRTTNKDGFEADISMAWFNPAYKK